MSKIILSLKDQLKYFYPQYNTVIDKRVTKRQYMKPCIKAFVTAMEVLTTSNSGYSCDKYCKLWHICRDRGDKLCLDYKF